MALETAKYVKLSSVYRDKRNIDAVDTNRFQDIVQGVNWTLNLDSADHGLDINYRIFLPAGNLHSLRARR